MEMVRRNVIHLLHCSSLHDSTEESLINDRVRNRKGVRRTPDFASDLPQSVRDKDYAPTNTNIPIMEHSARGQVQSIEDGHAQ